MQPDSRAMMILPYSFISRFQPMIGADGTFTFLALPEAEYTIRVGMNSASTIALADILLDGKGVKNGAVPIGAKPPGLLEIRLTDGGGPALSSVAPAPRGAVAAANSTAGARGPRGNTTAPAAPARGNTGPANSAPSAPLVVLAPSGRPAVLQTRLESLPSGSAKDCGHAGKEALPTVVQCVEQAIARKENYIASFPQASVDSQVVLGIASAGSGKVIQLLFDSADSRVSTMRDCAEPQLAVSAQFVRVACH
jgi:hypothetical protein